MDDYLHTVDNYDGVRDKMKLILGRIKPTLFGVEREIYVRRTGRRVGEVRLIGIDHNTRKYVLGGKHASFGTTVRKRYWSKITPSQWSAIYRSFKGVKRVEVDFKTTTDKWYGITGGNREGYDIDEQGCIIPKRW